MDFFSFFKNKSDCFSKQEPRGGVWLRNEERGCGSLAFFSENAKKCDFCANCYFKGVIFVDFLSFDETLPLAIQKLFWYNI